MQSPTADAARALGQWARAGDSGGQQETAGDSGDSGDRKHTSLITSAAARVQQRDTHSSPSRKIHFCPMQPVLSSSPHPAVLPGTLLWSTHCDSPRDAALEYTLRLSLCEPFPPVAPDPQLRAPCPSNRSHLVFRIYVSGKMQPSDTAKRQ